MCMVYLHLHTVHNLLIGQQQLAGACSICSSFCAAAFWCARASQKPSSCSVSHQCCLMRMMHLGSKPTIAQLLGKFGDLKTTAASMSDLFQLLCSSLLLFKGVPEAVKLLLQRRQLLCLLSLLLGGQRILYLRSNPTWVALHCDTAVSQHDIELHTICNVIIRFGWNKWMDCSVTDVLAYMLDLYTSERQILGTILCVVSYMHEAC